MLTHTPRYMVDSVSIAIGALLGTPPVTAFVESGAGIGEGGKTGLTAMSTGKPSSHRIFQISD